MTPIKLMHATDRRKRAGALLAGAVFAMCLLAPGPALATRGLATGFLDPLFWSADSAVRDQALSSAKHVNASYVRIVVRWDGSMVSRPTNPADPDDPAYRFSATDQAVESALANGLEPILLITRAPGWAEGPRRSKGAPAGTWKPDPDALADFVAAVATRYSEVRYIQLWNEPNLRSNLTPQWIGSKLIASEHYREMLNAAEHSLRSAAPNDELLTAGLAPYGDDRGTVRSRPLTFLRKLFCLNGKLKRTCKAKTRFSILSLHAFNTSGSPMKSAIDDDDMNPVDMGNAKRILRAAERERRVPGKRHPIWVTESWWETNPPEKGAFTLQQQARYIQQTDYLAWKVGAEVAIFLRIRDEKDPRPGDTGAEGIYFYNGDPKPSARAFAFPFVAERRKGKQVTLWGKSPKVGTVVIEEKEGAGWKRLTTLRAGSSLVFTSRARIKGPAELRARSGHETSLAWRLR